MSDLFENILTESYMRQRLQSIKEGKQMAWEQIAHAFYQLLDDIDTVDDACKESSESFRSMVMRLQAKKNQYMASFDGYTAQRVNENGFFKKGHRSYFETVRDALAQATHKKPFADLAPAQQKQIIRNMEKKGFRRDRANESCMGGWAKEELERAGLFDKDSDYDGMLGEAVLELIDTFSKQGHSGMSAALTTELFSKLVSYKPLTALTNDPSEWTKVHEDLAQPHMLFQSKRDPSCFSSDGGKTYWSVDDPCFDEIDEETGITYHVGGPERWAKREIHTSVDVSSRKG